MKKREYAVDGTSNGRRSRVALHGVSVGLTVLTLFSLSACGEADDAAISKAEVTTTAVTADSAASTVAPSAVPQTTTAVPTVALTPDDVVAAFAAAGLEAETPRAMAPKDYGMAPLVAVAGVRFFIPSLGEGAGGRVMQFANDADLAKTKDYYVELGRSSAATFSWTYDRNLILVQINGDLPPETASKYEAVLTGL